MWTFFKAIFLLVVGAALLIWVVGLFRANFPSISISNLLRPTTVTFPTTSGMGQMAAASAGNNTLATILTGTVVLDAISSSAKIPYIKYYNSNGKIETKQLIFDDIRGCSPNAGDLPCANRNVADAYPKLVDGQRITLTGRSYFDRFIVEYIHK